MQIQLLEEGLEQHRAALVVATDEHVAHGVAHAKLLLSNGEHGGQERVAHDAREDGQGEHAADHECGPDGPTQRGVGHDVSEPHGGDGHHRPPESVLDGIQIAVGRALHEIEAEPTDDDGKSQDAEPPQIEKLVRSQRLRDRPERTGVPEQPDRAQQP